MRDPAKFIAKELHDTMKGLGTRDRNLIRIIVMHLETDLKDIADAFYTVRLTVAVLFASFSCVCVCVCVFGFGFHTVCASAAVVTSAAAHHTLRSTKSRWTRCEQLSWSRSLSALSLTQIFLLASLTSLARPLLHLP